MDLMDAEELKSLQDIVSFDEVKPSVAAFAFPQNYIYYEWNQADRLWVKLRDADPDPDQSILAPGKFDGQIIEISSK